MNTYYPRHKLDIDIVHRGLKCDKVIGLCDVNGTSSRPRAFLIDLQAHMERELYIKTLFHELTHMAQWIDGSLRFQDGKMRYCQEPVENYDYEHQPHEIEARENEQILYDFDDGQTTQTSSASGTGVLQSSVLLYDYKVIKGEQ